MEDRVKALEDHASAVDKLIDELVVVTDVTVDGDTTTVTLSDGTSFVVYGACDTLQYRVDDGVLEVSADGQNWVAVEQTADCVIVGVVVNDDNTVTFTLADGTEFTVALAELIEFAATRGQVYVAAGTTKDVNFTINDAVVDINVMNQPFGWSATVAEATEVEGDDNGGAAPMPLAAGGTDYVLQITGPTKDLVNAGFAAKDGVVSVHFNTAAGACKVLKVDVNLAEVTLSVDNKGVVTITNTIVEMQKSYQGEYLDFADFFIGIMPKARYEAYGNDALREGFYWGDYEGGSVTTMRSTGLSSYVSMYEEGVYEVETITLTVDQLGKCFWPTYTFNYGEDSIIFISLDSEMVDYYEVPLLDNAIMVEYKKSLIDAQLVEGSAAWNNVTYKMSLAGYSMYVIGWLSDDEVQETMMYMEGVDTVEEFLAEYFKGYGVTSAGAMVSGTFLDEEIELASLAEMSLFEWAPALNADTTYHFYIYPFNAVTEMDLYTHQFDAANLYYFGTFETEPLVVGDFEVGAECVVVNHDAKNISVDVTFDADYTVFYQWTDAASYDHEQSAAAIMADLYYTETVNVVANETENFSNYDYYGLSNPVYLAMVVINEAGEYVYVEKEFLYVEPVLPVVEITSFEYVGRSYELDDNPETGGGDFVYDFTCADGTSYRMGLYWSYADAATGAINIGTYNYCYNALNAMYASWAGFVIESSEYYYDSTLTVTEETITWKIPGQVEYVYTIGSEGGEDPEQPEVFEVSASAALVTDTTFNGFNPYDVTFGFENGDKVVVRFNTDGAQYLHLGNWQNDDWQNPHYISVVKYNGENAYISACNVAYENDAYTVTMSVFEYTNYTTLNYTYTGAIEGLIAPEACDCFKQNELPTTENLTLSLLKYAPYSGYCDVVFCDSEQKNVIVVSLNDCPLVDCTYTVETSTADGVDPGTMYLNGCYVEYGGYQSGTSAYLKSGSVDVKANGDGTYTITFDLVLTNDQVYSGVYTGAIA